ncbi:MAG: hypothetical protein HON90_07445, partial [Halobacteriovoraceae bacterium]|nr:hypothetical protein [Halobacteriovoraceae bacterium]
MKWIKSFSHLLIAATVSLILTACLPEQEIRQVPSTNINQTTGTDSTITTDTKLQLSENTNFLQVGSLKSSSTLSLFSGYTDTFLLRGNDIITYFEENSISSVTNYCMVANFPGAIGASAKSTYIISARIRSYYNSDLKRKEYFLQMAPNDEVINQGECLTVSLVNQLKSIYGATTTLSFNMKDVCPSCSTNLTSASLRLFTPTGTEETKLAINHLYLNIMPDIGSTSTQTPTICTQNSNCTSLNFNCCLAGQCVNHGQVRSEVDTTSDKYNIALQIISARPELIKNYTEVFYVCPSLVPTNVDNTPSDTIDPYQQANNLFTELENLYNCTTPVIDEFSICAKEFQNASTLMTSAPYAFSSEPDDLTFKSITPVTGNNIVQINYGGETLYKEKLLSTDSEIALSTSAVLGVSNDDSTNAQNVTIQKTLTANSLNDILTLYYRVDGTCEKLGSNLARCKKYYKQGQSSIPARSSDHASGNHTFAIPSYADTSFNVIVSVGGSPVPQDTQTWSLSGNNIIFHSTQYPIYDNQEIKITYFVSTNVSQLLNSQSQAQDKINGHCACDPNKEPCSLKPQTTQINGVDKVTSYVCIYPTVDVPDTPLQKTVYLSAKTVPHKFYDSNGVNYDLGDSASELPQEGTKFEYTDGHNLKPNNISQHIGFNEIYGTMNLNASSPLPPKVIQVDKGKSYDLFVDAGAFSSCLSCGVDYFSSMQKIFPTNFKYKGGGYLPDLVECRRRTNLSDYRADDLRFGRACFVPASMIPWTHISNSNVTTQRRNRLAAQHFLFANGYNKDWYGFDYGSVIGSFDGIKWFAIGNQRKIKADSNKLYLAVNAYYADLTINNTFTITINEINAILNAGSLVLHDTDNDGAQCQRAHFCSKDEDCIAQLGYDYTCSNVSELQTPWPIFDTNGNEVSGSLTKSLLGLVGGSNGQSKRCVYRGVGAACATRNFNVTTTNSYTNTTTPSLHTCSNNSFCADTNQSLFNTKITRYADSPANQNIQSFIINKTDTFGLAARNLGRPYEYHGNQTVPTDVRLQLSQNNINAVCIPGKDIQNISSLEQGNYFNTTTRNADKTTNIGLTRSETTSFNENYFAACPATGDDGNYTHLQDINLNSPDHKPFAIRNNLSTNSLRLPSLASSNMINDSTALITALGYNQNSCLRAPGAKCFSDFECAPNNFIANKF